MKETANVKAGQISRALEVTTLVSDPYTVDMGRVSDSRYVGALVDANGNPTVRVSKLSGVTTITFTENKDYTITGDGADVAVDTGDASGITIADAVAKSIAVRPAGSGTFEIKVSGSNIVSDGITCVNGSSADSNVKISGKTPTSSISSANPGAAAIKSEGDIEIEDIQIKSEGKGIQSSGTVRISGGSNKIEAVSEAVSASDVEMTGGLLDATSTDLGEDESVISADNSIKLVGGKITADTSGSSGNSFGVKSDDGDIIVDGEVSIGGKPSYSKDPVDSKGDSVVMVKVTFADENGTELYAASMNKGTELDLANIDISMSDGSLYAQSKPGYKLSWTAVDGRTYGADEVYGALEGDVNFIAVWTWIVVDISSDADITFKITGNASYKTAYTGMTKDTGDGCCLTGKDSCP